ncbi:MAG TPA: hypothetical protein VJ875_16900 [Pyrinomonadaceae bacterium]|nr:hypothetical protein [Pyrinomonadaceae bacterium]
MRIIKDTTWILLAVGITVAALTVGFLIEFGRADQMRSQAVIEACVLSLMSYFTPTLWLRRHYGNDFGLAWLIVPVVGTILVLLMVVHIPNEISIWNRSDGEIFIADALRAIPTQMFLFFFGFLLYSAISCFIIGLVQVIALGLLALRRFLSKRLVTPE